MDTTIRCNWCYKRYKTLRAFSDWEQQTLGLYGKPREWHRLCNRCANRRLNNPWNALLDMRQISEPATSHE